MPEATKQVWVANSKATCFEIQDTNGVVVFNGDLVDKGEWEASEEKLKYGDFSSFKTPGSYVVWVADKGISYTFDIKKDIYDEAFVAAMKTYYYQRASAELTEEYAGKWHRPLGQPDTMVYFHESTGKPQTKPKAYKNASKGWYDAGDLNKYVVNSGVTVGTLFTIFDMYPDLFSDNQLNIPESGNGIPDFLDELKWQLDWFYTMQDDDGGVFVKISELDWEWAVMPHEWNDKERYFIGKSTAAALNFAAVFAMANRTYKDIYPDLAKQYLSAAEKAWAWAEKTPNNYYLGTPGVGSGNYDDTNLQDEFLWAASELYITTGNEKYKTTIDTAFFTPKFEVCAWRTFMSNIGLFSLLKNENKLEKDKKEQIQKEFVALANQFTDSINTLPYQIPSQVFEWGSNSEFLNRALIIGFAYNLTNDAKYYDALTRFMDYIFGTNAVGMSFVTGFGENSPMHPHHRQCYADGVKDPIPGFIVGGPNAKREDDVNNHCPSCKTDYPSRLPAQSYFDHFHSYASNEVTINWNASLVAVLGVIQSNSK